MEKINSLSNDEAITAFLDCCHSTTWAALMSKGRPYKSQRDLSHAVDAAFDELTTEDWLEAFQAHPKIGDLNSLHEKFSSTRERSSGEQQGVNASTYDQIQELHELNKKYETRHGFIFIIFAAGKAIEEFLSSIKQRLNNSTNQELKNAALEQRKIAKLRLKLMLDTHHRSSCL